MRILSTLLLPLLVLGLWSAPKVAHAQQKSLQGSFASSFEVIVDNCDGAGASLEKVKVRVTKSGPTLLVKIPTLPDMKGTTGKRGKLKADGRGEGSATVLRSKFRFSGRITGSKLQAVLVAEYFQGDRPQCTQSWSVTGRRAAP